jgi:hypothetical protein
MTNHSIDIGIAKSVILDKNRKVLTRQGNNSHWIIAKDCPSKSESLVWAARSLAIFSEAKDCGMVVRFFVVYRRDLTHSASVTVDLAPN